MPAAQQPDAERQARELLDELAHWESLGTTSDGEPLKSTGEGNARIAELRRRLDLLGARFHREAAGYVLDGVAGDGSPRP